MRIQDYHFYKRIAMEAQKTVKKEAPKQNLNYQRDKDKEPVKGIFRFHEVPGGSMSFSLKLHKGDPVETYTLRDGEVKTVPLGVAKHLNKNCSYPEYGYVKTDIEGNMQDAARIIKKIRRCSFQSLEFIDIEDVSNDLQVAEMSI
jgi:hypothetical protein